MIAMGSAAGASTTTSAGGQVPVATDQEADDDATVPAAHAPVAAWQAWAASDRARAQAHDWAADSAARGCTLIDIDFVTEVDPGYNAALGAPADLATIRVDRVEECEEAAHAGPAASDDLRARAVPPGPQCNSGTQGPGTICLTSSGNWITASWQNRGAAAQTGFLRIYQIPTGASNCPTGTTWHTSATMTWSGGQTRSTSKTQTLSGAYSASIWRQNLLGHSNWGSTCAQF